MKNATRVFASTFGAIMALAGIEHGIGEVLQGNAIPSGLIFPSWPEAEFFRSLGGEPAMSVIPNLLITGILAIMVSLALLVWSIWFVQKKHGGWIMILLSAAMLPVGGGIFPPILGIIVGVVATKINSPLFWWRRHLSNGIGRFFAGLWAWSLAICVFAWLAAIFGVGILNYFFGEVEVPIILTILISAFGTFLLTVFTGFAYNVQMPFTEKYNGIDILGEAATG